MCSGLFSSSAKRASPARHASASGWPTSRRAVWSDWTMSGLSAVKRLLPGRPVDGVLVVRQLPEPLPRRPRPLDAGKEEMALVLAEAAPGVDPDPADLEGLDLPR